MTKSTVAVKTELMEWIDETHGSIAKQPFLTTREVQEIVGELAASDRKIRSVTIVEREHYYILELELFDICDFVPRAAL